MSLILIDGSALVYRSHYAFANRPLTAPSGELTSVAFGFCNAVLRLIQDYRPEQLAVVFDVKGKNFRHEMYPEYKANRKPMPEELAEQLPRLRELLAAWGLAVIERSGVEADDVIGSLARLAATRFEQVWLYSGDKDFIQLLDDTTAILKPGRRGDDIKVVKADDVRKEYQLEPTELIEVFALSGDKADNIPGAPGVGDKTAQKLIREFGSLDGLYEKLETSKLTPRLKRVLGENREQVYLSRDLFVIRRDMDIDLNWDDLATVLPVGSEISTLLQELGLRRVCETAARLARTLPEDVHDAASGAASDAAPEPEPGDEPQPRATPTEPAPTPATWNERLAERGYRRLATVADIEAWLATLDPAAPLAIDTETDSLRRDVARLVGICLAGYEADGRRAAPVYIPVLWREADGQDPGQTGTLFPVGKEVSQLAEIRIVLAPILAADESLKVGQNLKFDEWILDRHGLPLGGVRFDTMLASYVLDPGRRSHGLDDLVLEYLNHRMMPFGELFNAGDRQKDILGVEAERLALYAAEDADYTLRLYEVLAPMIEDSGMADLFRDLEMPLSLVLLRMERNGIMLDRPFLEQLRVRFETELAAIEERIHAAAGEAFNIQSPKQLAVILFEKLGLQPIKKTATGWSTDVSVLTALADEHELPALVLEYRQIAKLQNTYVETLPELVNPETGLIHTSYNQAVAATGRLSSSDPNLQNIPVRTELGRQIRRAFIPRQPGNVFLSADYSQVELRLLAHLAEDPELLKAFADGADVHRRTAALIAGVAEDEVDPEMRNKAKAINFGVIYGMGARALARQIKVTVKQAGAFIGTYFETYPGVKDYIDRTKDLARRQGWVETLLGRRRLLPDIDSSNNRIRSFQERIAVNTPIQGTAADLIKLAMLAIEPNLEQSGSGALLLLQVHDELVLEVPSSELVAVSDLVRADMESALELKVPLVVDLHSGENWAEAHG